MKHQLIKQHPLYMRKPYSTIVAQSLKTRTPTGYTKSALDKLPPFISFNDRGAKNAQTHTP